MSSDVNTDSEQHRATLLIAPSKNEIPQLLHEPIIATCLASIELQGCFTLALSGGSLPNFLSTLSDTFKEMSIDPQFDKWHVCLADERLVPSTDDDSNLKALKENMLDKVNIPPEQVYGIDESLLHLPNSSKEIAKSYELNVIDKLLALSGGKLDCAVLGFGPDGHTCSLFPNHELLKESEKRVTYLEDSPKPPPKRITLTYPVLNNARCVIFCGAGSSKNPILKDSFEQIVESNDGSEEYEVVMRIYDEGDESSIPLYPCAMVRTADPVIWVVDADAAEGLNIKKVAEE